MAENDNLKNDDQNRTGVSGRRCSLCGKTEEEAGGLIDLPTGMAVCRECIQKSMDTFQNDENFRELMEKLPPISFMNIEDLFGGRRNAEEKKKEPAQEEHFRMSEIPRPHEIKAGLDRYVVGQDQAKKVLSVAVYNHYKRIITEEKLAEQKKNQDDLQEKSRITEIDKSNILMIGPTGSGKTYLVQVLAKLLHVPLAITDATSLTEAGYIGDDIESVVSKLLAAAGNRVDFAEHGIIFIDEIDKIAKKKNTNQRDVSGESVQQGMLKLLEGAEVEVPVGASSKNAMVPMKMVNTKNILFIVGGAFPGLEEIITERLSSKSSIGFKADLKDRYDHEKNLIRSVTTEDLRKFGMIPEFLGRLPILCTLDSLSEEMLVRILKEPENAILRQYQELLAMDEVKLSFEEGALSVIAEKALEKETGARALRSILEEFMLDIMYEIPKDDSIGEVVVTADYLNHRGAPQIIMRGAPRLERRHNDGR